MNARLIIIDGVLPKDPAQVRLPKDDHVVETFPSDRADQPLRVPILPRRARRNGPVAAKSSAMPAHDGLRPQDYHGLENRRAPTIKLDGEQAIAVGEVDPAAHLALQHNHLASECGIL